MYIPEGPARPDRGALDRFFADAKAARPEAGLGETYDTRWIGLDRDSTDQIIALIQAQDKRGTFTLPWIVERTDQPTPQDGLPIVLIDFDGRPRLLVRLTGIYDTRFDAITGEDTAIDGSPVRDIAVWRPLHTQYWTALLSPFGLTVRDDMPVIIEPFELLYDAG